MRNFKLLKDEHILGLINVHFNKDRICKACQAGKQVSFDDYSRFTWVFFVFDKSEVQGKVKTFIRRAQREFELPTKKVRSDNGSEFRNSNVEEFLDEEGIKHEFQLIYPSTKWGG
jgi:hypothetical protein